MKRLSLFIVMIVTLTIGCAETAWIQSKMDYRMDELTYEHMSRQLAEKKAGTLSIGSFVVEDVIPPDTRVAKTSGFVVPLLIADYRQYKYRADLGYTRIANDYKEFMRESLVQEVKQSGLISYVENQGDITIDVTINKIESSASFEEGRWFGPYTAGQRIFELGSLNAHVQADVILKYKGAIISNKKVQGNYKADTEDAYYRQPIQEYTSAMIRGLSAAVRELNENIVKMINLDASTITSTKSHPPEAPITEPLVTASTPTGSIYRDPVTGMEFVFVKGGCYRMGDVFGDGNSYERPVHDVCIDDYYLGKYEVTQGQWRAVMRDSPDGASRGNNYPVSGVSWEDAHTFALKLKHKTGINYRLPTEAEWEYAARDGGKDEKWPGTNTESELKEYAWYSSESKPKLLGLTRHSASKEESAAVGKKKPNELGIYDIAGNVSEWVLDWYDEDYYKQSVRNNPKGTRGGRKKVLRGGSVHDDAAHLRTTHRDKADNTYDPDDVGFRLLIELQ